MTEKGTRMSVLRDRVQLADAIDLDRIDALADSSIGWKAKGFPFDPAFATTRQLLALNRPLSACGFTTPFATVSASALEHNLSVMADYCASASALLAPHGKTTMSPQLFAKQLEYGAWGITVATAWQARVCRQFGITNVLMASQLADVEAVRWAASEFGAPGTSRLISLVDSEAQVAFITHALRGTPVRRPLDVLIEVGYSGGRTGARSDSEVAAVAAAIRACPQLRLVGVGAFEGLMGHDSVEETLRQVRTYLKRVRATAERLDADGHFDEVDRVILSAGGSAYFDFVVETLSGPLPTHADRVDLILRSGSYITHDDQLYGEVSPFTRRAELAGETGGLQQAATVWASVISTPEPGLALLNAGKRDVPTDVANPRPYALLRDGRTTVTPSLDAARITGTNDQHAYLALPDNADILVGDIIGLRISHPCTFFDRWKHIPVVDDDQVVVDVLTTIF